MKQIEFKNEIDMVSKSIADLIEIVSEKISETVSSKTLTDNDKRRILINTKDDIDDLTKLLK